MKCLKRTQIAIIIGGLNIVSYCMFCATLLDNIKFDRFSHYDYDDYREIYTSYELRQQARERREIYCKLYMGACVLMMVLSALLIWGVTKKRSGCILPWLLASFVVLIYSIIIVLDDIFMKSSFQGVANAIIFFAALGIIFGFQILCLAIVYSVYRNFELEKHLKRLNIPTDETHKENPYPGDSCAVEEPEPEGRLKGVKKSKSQKKESKKVK